MNRQVIKNRIRKVLAYTVAGISFTVISAFLTLQIPVVQEAIIKRYLRGFAEATGFPATVGQFRLLWFDRLEIEDLRVYDPAENTMIAAGRVRVNFQVSELFGNGDINIDGVSLDSARVFLTKIDVADTSRQLNINVFVERIREGYRSADSTGGRTPRINIGEAVINAGEFRYIDPDKDSVKNGFNYNQFTIDIDEAQLQQFMVLGDTTEFNVQTLLATDRESKLAVRQLSTFFRYSRNRMEFTDLQLLANRSVISDSIIFSFDHPRDLSNFVDKVHIDARLTNTIVQPADLALFVPAAARMPKPVMLNGTFRGLVNDFRFTNMSVETGQTALRGSLSMEGLPDVEETFIVLNLNDSHLHFSDLAFAVNPKITARLMPIGTVNLEGQFLGYPTDFVANGTFSGSLGTIRSDINFKVNEENFDRSVYSGKLALKNFYVGRYLNDTINFQRVNLDGQIKGSGLSLGSADFVLNGKVNSIGIRGYNYTNIETNARFASELFEGFLRVNDPNLEFTARGSVDLRDGADVIRIEAQLDTAWLHNLKLTDRYIFLQSALDINTRGLHIDSLQGTADLRDFTIHYNDKQLSLANIHLVAQQDKARRSIGIESTLIDAGIRGDFLISDISRDIQKLLKEVMLNIRNDKDAIAEYYATQKYRPKPYQADFDIAFKNIQPIADLLETNIELAEMTVVEGKFTSGYTSILQAFTRLDTLSYNGMTFFNTDAEITASKIADSTSVLAVAFLSSERQVLSRKLRTKNLLAEAVWNQHHIDFEIDAEQEDQHNYVELSGEVDFLHDSTLIRLLPSTINLLDKRWQVDPRNMISLQRNNIGIWNLKMMQDDQHVLLNGRVTDNGEDKIEMEIENLDLSFLTSLTGIDVKGKLAAWFELRDFYRAPHLQNRVEIDSLIVDDFLIGNVLGSNEWDTVRKEFDLQFFIDRNNNRIVDLAGSYNPSRPNPLDVNATLNNANLKIVEPFFDYMFSDIGGTISGNYRIAGALASPAITGEGMVNAGRLRINYLNTVYDFTGVIGLSPNSIYFKDVKLTDAFMSKASFEGTITHNAFRDMRLNLQSTFTNFHVLNTTARDNRLFYGQGFGTGNLRITGPVNNLRFFSIARTDRNTRIYIPIGDDNEIQQKEFIKFVNFSDSTFQQRLTSNISNKLDLSGITLDFNITVTDDAYCEILLNDQAGDKIRGRGNGEIQLQLDTKGEFNMFGPFVFTEGYYTFTLYDLFNKEFEINKGSRITWYGDAYEGQLDIDASYNQLASLAPILTDASLRDEPALGRKYPVQVLIELDGPMLSPEINFDIVAHDLPQSIVVPNHPPVRLDFEFQAFKNRMDEQELKRQVFSLIVLRRISPPESFNTSGSDVINSVSELFSNQLSNFVSQMDENLEIDVDFSRMDEEQFNTFQLRLSYTFLNGRLRITRDGTFYSSQNNSFSPEQNLSTLAGDWMVDYILTPDGKLKIKMYNRTNINPIFNTGSQQNSSVTTGFSINHTQSFNELKELWNSRKKRTEESEEDDDEKEQPDTSTTGRREDDDE